MPTKAIDISKLKTHPAAELFPMLDKKDFELLKQDVKVRGIRQPILVKGDVILDGRNRIAAAQELKLPIDQIPIEEYKGVDEVGEIIANNILRRHLTDNQRAALTAKLLGPAFSKEGEAAMKTGAKGAKQAAGTTGSRIAKAAKVTVSKGLQAAVVAKHAPEELDNVIAGKGKLRDAEKAAKAKLREKNGKVAKPKVAKSLEDTVKAKFIRFMDGFSIQDHRRIREILRELLKVDGAISAKTPVPAAKK